MTARLAIYLHMCLMTGVVRNWRIDLPPTPAKARSARGRVVERILSADTGTALTVATGGGSMNLAQGTGQLKAWDIQFGMDRKPTSRPILHLLNLIAGFRRSIRRLFENRQCGSDVRPRGPLPHHP